MFCGTGCQHRNRVEFHGIPVWQRWYPTSGIPDLIPGLPDCGRKVLDHDFPIAELGKVAPYGIYTVNDNTGYVNIGTSHDTAKFAVQSIRNWWYSIGRHTFPNARKLYITADGGESNGSRNRL